MSDLISTPSQPQSLVSNDAFEVLIDLLATDGIDDGHSKLAGETQANVSLRDPSGKLDFDKIRLMFAAQNGSSTRHVPHDDADSEDEPHSCPSSTVPSRPQSISPKPIIERPPAGHRRSSTFGNLHWAAIHENPAKVEDVAPTLSREPLSLDELNTALAGAHEEVRSLRQKYDELQALVARRSGADHAKPRPAVVVTESPCEHNGREEIPASSQAQPGAIVPPTLASLDVSTGIANLSGDEAKRALTALACSLNVSLDAINALATTSNLSPQPASFSFDPYRQHDVASIARALKFLGTVDDLVWRRTSASSGPRTLLPVFSEENMVALVARLELWERAVRRPSRI